MSFFRLHELMCQHVNMLSYEYVTISMYCSVHSCYIGILILTLRDPPRPGPAQRPAHVRGIRIGVQEGSAPRGGEGGLGAGGGGGSGGWRGVGVGGGGVGWAGLQLPLVLANRPVS